MAKPTEKPSERKLSPWKQFLEDASWDILFFRAFGNLLVGLLFEEGKAVKRGWFAFIIFMAIAFWCGCHYCEQKSHAAFESLARKEMLIDAKYRDELNSSLSVSRTNLETQAILAFQNGDYRYSRLFVDKCESLNENDEWKMQGVIYREASILAANPTADGFKTFTNHVGVFISAVEKKYPASAIYNGQITSVIRQLHEVTERLPSPENQYTSNLLVHILEFKKLSDKNLAK